MKIRFSTPDNLSQHSDLTLIRTEDDGDNGVTMYHYELSGFSETAVRERMEQLGFFEGDYDVVPEPMRLKYAHDQLADNGQEVIVLIDENGEVHATLYRLGMDLWRVACRRSIRRFHGLDNAKAFAKRKLEETSHGQEITIEDGEQPHQFVPGTARTSFDPE